MNRVIKRPPSASASPFPSGLIKNIIIITAILSSSYDDVINVINGNDYDNNSNDNNNQSRSHLLCSGFQMQRIQRFRSPLRADVGVGAGVGSGVHRYTHSHEINHNYHTSRSNRSHDSQRASSNHHALFMSGSDRDDDIQVPPLSLAFNSDLYGSSSSSSKTSTNADTKKEISSSLDQALIEARELKERAARERLEAEKMSVQLTLDKIALLEKELEKIAGDSSSSSSSNGQSNGQSNSEMGATTGEVGEVQVQVPSSKDVVNIAEKEFDPKMLKRSQDLQSQIQDLKKLLNVSNGSSSSTDSSSTTASTNNIDMKIEESMQNIIVEEETTTSTSTSSSEMKKDDDMDMDIPPMPKDVYQKRMDAFKRFPSEIKGIYASAVGADENDTLETIVEKVYLQEQIEKMKKKENKSDDSDDSTSLLDIANAQAGYSMLPPPIQAMISEAVGLSNEKNTTKIIEKLIDTNKVRPTGEFGGVEFAMGDIEEENEEEEKKKRGKEREFTKEEMKSAIDLFENLPLPMKTMLANGLEDGDGAGGSIDSSNSTAIIEAMIREKKILPSDEGVEFVVFGNGDDSDMDIFGEAMESFEGDNYVRSMLPAVMRKEGNMPSEKDADAFFAEVLGSRTFNPISKPERVPGGYVIRGENRLKTSDELVVALEKALEKSSVADKLRLYYIRDPTLVTEEQFETNTFELPVVFITGPDISPETNRLVKPLITVLGGFCVATFSLAVCFSNEDAVQDPLWLEQMASPLIMSILFTQLAHEAAHQVVAFKDKVGRAPILLCIVFVLNSYLFFFNNNTAPADPLYECLGLFFHSINQTSSSKRVRRRSYRPFNLGSQDASLHSRPHLQTSTHCLTLPFQDHWLECSYH